MKVIYLASRYPLPVGDGRSSMIAQTIRYFVGRGDSVLVACPDTASDGAPSLSELGIAESYVFRLPNFFSRLANFFKTPSAPLQENLFCSQRLIADFRAQVRQFDPDLIVCDMIRMSPFLRGWDGRKVIEIDDLLSKRYRLMYARAGIDLLGGYYKSFPRIYSWLARPFARPLLALEARRIAARERQVVSEFDACTLVSGIEADELRKSTGGNCIFDIPPYVDVEAKPRRCQFDDDSDAKKLLFIGNLTVNQNIASLEYLCERVLPYFSEGRRNIRLVVAGKYDQRARHIIESAGQSQLVQLTGFVDDLMPIVRSSRALLAPIAFGTGIKTKIISAFAFGLPVVTNSVGAEGIVGEWGKDFLVHDTADAIASAAIRICDDDSFARQLAEASFRLYSNCYSREVVYAKYDQMLEAVRPE